MCVCVDGDIVRRRRKQRQRHRHYRNLYCLPLLAALHWPSSGYSPSTHIEYAHAHKLCVVTEPAKPGKALPLKERERDSRKRDNTRSTAREP